MIRLTNVRYTADVQVNSTKNLIFNESMVREGSKLSSKDMQSDSLSNHKRASAIDPDQLWPRVSPWLNLGNFPTVLLYS